MKNGWSIGQYSVYRTFFGLYLLQHFLGLLPWGAELFSSSGVLPDGHLSPLLHLFPNIFALWDSPLVVSVCLGIAAALSLLFIAGKYDRVAAVLIWYLWACFYARNSLIGNPSMPFVGWLLLAHALIRSSWSAPMKDKEAACEWRLPSDIYLAAWILMSVAYTYSGYTKLVSPSWLDGSALSRVLANPLARDTVIRAFMVGLPPWFMKAATWAGLALELSFAPLALFRRLRPMLWMAMVCMHLSLLLLVNFSDLTVGMLILHFFTFDPSWVPHPKAAGQTIFFDGECGLCHGFVRFVLQEERSASPFSFAPLRGDFIRRTVPEDVRVNLPDSVVVMDEKGAMLTRSTAVIYVMQRLGSLWWIASSLLTLVPRGLRDAGYIAVASVRTKIAGKSQSACPIVGEPWRVRFLS